MNISHYKRFKEYLVADREFEKQIRNDPENTLKRYKLDPEIDVEILRPMWNGTYRQQITKEGPPHLLSEIEKEFLAQLQDNILLNCLKDESLKNPSYKAWRQRQKERVNSLFHKFHSEKLLHVPFAFELTEGCSGRCPFCAFMPSPLKDIFYYTHENATLWKEILQITQDILGAFAGASVCYWATEPFDNPGYEKFCLDFASVHGFFPYTSTIKHVENPARMRNFLRLSKEYGRIHHRFSIVSLPVLRKLYQEFSAEELASIQLTLNNRESVALYSNTGRARELYKKETAKDKIYPEGTSACLSGFLVNMINRTIKLITPCNPSEKWPFGYMVYEETSFNTAYDFKDRITTMIETYMPLSPGSDNIVAFRPDLKFRTIEDGFEVSTKFMTRTFRNSPVVRELGKIVNKGKHTLQEIVDMFEIYCLPLDYIPETIQKMLQSGILQEPLMNLNANL